MRAGRGLLVALAALGVAGCDTSADAPDASATTVPTPRAAASAPAAPSPTAKPPGESALTPEQAERAFTEKVRAVALSIDDIDGTREPSLPDDVFAPLASAGIVGGRFDRQYDYAAWSRPRRPLRFLGHQVMLVLAEEMRNGFIGCCVDRGVTLYLRKAQGDAALLQFASQTRCRLEPASENLYLGSLKSAGQPLSDVDNLVALSCHERDIFDDQTR